MNKDRYNIYMKKKVLGVFSAAFLAITLSGCGYDGHFRYPCQDPANWENAECKPPICEASGTCTTDLLGYDPLATESPTVEEESDTIEEDVVEDVTESEATETEIEE